LGPEKSVHLIVLAKIKGSNKKNCNMDGVNVLALAGQGWCVIGTYHKVNNSYG